MFQWTKSVIEELGYPGIAAFVFIENVFPPIGGFLVTEENLVGTVGQYSEPPVVFAEAAGKSQSLEVVQAAIEDYRDFHGANS